MHGILEGMTKLQMISIRISLVLLTKAQVIVGASLSEPHTSELFRAIVHGTKKLRQKSVNLHVFRDLTV